MSVTSFALMKNESMRLKTYHNWSHEFLSASSLAKAGFFYLNADRVQCAFCRGILSKWKKGYDDPMTEHARHFPFCPFILNMNVGNEPIDGVPPGYDVCGSCVEHIAKKNK